MGENNVQGFWENGELRPVPVFGQTSQVLKLVQGLLQAVCGGA
jgi:hypothetical protein